MSNGVKNWDAIRNPHFAFCILLFAFCISIGLPALGQKSGMKVQAGATSQSAALSIDTGSGANDANRAAVRPRPPLRRWQDVDQRLQECRRKFELNEQKYIGLLNQQEALKKSYNPNNYDPASIMNRQSMDKLLGSLHQAVEDGRVNAEDAGDLLANALLTRGTWETGLRNGNMPIFKEPGMDEQRKIWVGALERIEKEGSEGFAKAILGDKFGPVAMQYVPDRLKWASPLIGRNDGTAANPVRRALLENIRQNWLSRIERMEKQQESLSEELRRQERNLRQMHSMMENMLTEQQSISVDEKKEIKNTIKN